MFKKKPSMVYNNNRRFSAYQSLVFVWARTINFHSLIFSPTHFPPIFITGRALLQWAYLIGLTALLRKPNAWFPSTKKTCAIALHWEKCYWSNWNDFLVAHSTDRHFENLLYLSIFARSSFRVSLQINALWNIQCNRLASHSYGTGLVSH